MSKLRDINPSNSGSIHRVLILSRSPIKSDPRLLNQISWLQSNGVDVDVIGLGVKPEALNGEYHSLGQPNIALRIFCYLFFWGKTRFAIVVGRGLTRALKELSKHEHIYGHILLNDLDFVPATPGFFSKNLTLRNDTRFHIDLHEYFPGIVGNTKHRILFGRHINWLLRDLRKRKFYSLSSVSEDITSLYLQLLDTKIALSIENVPHKREIENGYPNEAIEIVYHGNCDRSRGIYVAVDALGIMSNEYRLNLMLTGDARELKKLKKHVLKKSYRDRISFIDPVPVTDIVATITQFDLGLALFDTRKNRSLELALPNKFFEYIQARLGVIAGSSESMIKICRDYGLGVGVESFNASSLANTLSKIDRSKVESLKLGANAAADVYHYENIQEKFLSRFSK